MLYIFVSLSFILMSEKEEYAERPVPSSPSVIGGLIGGIGVYPLVAKMQGHFKSGRLTAKGIGGSIGQGTAAGTTNTDQLDMPDSPSGSAFTTDAKDVNKNPDSIMDAKRDQVK